MEQNEKVKDKGEQLRMATQIQATPTLYGEDAIRVLKQASQKPTPAQIEKAKQRTALFKRIKKRGLNSMRADIFA